VSSGTLWGHLLPIRKIEIPGQKLSRPNVPLSRKPDNTSLSVTLHLLSVPVGGLFQDQFGNLFARGILQVIVGVLSALVACVEFG
jgi:hypothetical protein